MSHITFDQPELNFGGKVRQLPWLFVLLVMAVGAIGAAALYSAANGSFEPWARQHIIRFSIFMAVMLAFALVDIRIWFRLSYPAYVATVALLGGVEVAGKV